MKVGLIIDELAPGSTPKLIGWPIRKLAELGVQAEAIVIIEKDHWQKYKEYYDFHLAGVKIRYLFPKFPKWVQKINFKFPSMSFFSLHHLTSGFFSYRAIEPKEFDILIANCQYSTFVARNIKKHYGTPFLLLIWDPSTFTAKKIYKDRFGWKYPFLYSAARQLDKFAFKKCEAIITSGKFHHEYLRKLTDKPLEILSPGCFVKEQLPDFSSRKPMILTYDRWDIGNNPNIFLDILQKIERKDIMLTIGGFWHPESLHDDFLREIKKRKLEKRVKLLGPLDEKMIMELCSQAMVHIHPVHEAFGMQTLEAAACGCPVIIPKGSGVADLFEHGVHGYFPETENLQQLVHYVNEIFADRKRAEEMGYKAWQVAKQYTWKEYVLRLERIIKKYI